MKTIFASLLLLAAQSAFADVMRIDFPAEHTALTFGNCFVPVDSDSTYTIACADKQDDTYSEPINIGRQVELNATAQPDFEWLSGANGACRLHQVIQYETYELYAFSCYTDRISSDGFEASGNNEDTQ